MQPIARGAASVGQAYDDAADVVARRVVERQDGDATIVMSG